MCLTVGWQALFLSHAQILRGLAKGHVLHITSLQLKENPTQRCMTCVICKTFQTELNSNTVSWSASNSAGDLIDLTKKPTI